MGRLRKSYSDNFKHKILVDLIESKTTEAEIAAKYEISPSMVSEWKKEFIEGSSGKEIKRLKREILALQESNDALMKKVGEKELEVELLKKKTSHFDRKTSGSW